MKLSSALRKNRDVHLFLRLLKAFNNQRVIFGLRKVWKKQRSCTVQYFQGSIHTQSSTRKFNQITKISLVFPKDKPQHHNIPAENDSSCIEFGLYG